MPHVRVGDIELYHELIDYTEPWKPAPPPVVFVHGLGGDHGMWHLQEQYLLQKSTDNINLK